jgi:hypothetical protein
VLPMVFPLFALFFRSEWHVLELNFSEKLHSFQSTVGQNSNDTFSHLMVNFEI